MEFLQITEKNLIVKSNALIEARYKLETREQKLVFALVSSINKDDKDFKEYKVSVKDMAILLELSDWKKPNGRFYKQMKQIAKNVVGYVLEIPTGKNNYIISTWFSSVEYVESDGYFKICFDPKLKPYLLELKEHFTKYFFWNVSKLKSSYSIRIYELLKQYEKIGKRSFLIQDLRDILQIEANEYVKFDHFHTKIIKHAYKELPQKTDIRFDYEFGKTGKKYTHIVFYIYRQEQAHDGQNEDQTELAFEEVSATTEVEPISEIIRKIMSFGISENQARDFEEQFDEAYILENLEIIESHIKSRKITDIGAYTAKALRTDYRKQTSIYELEQQKQAEAEAKKKSEQEAEAKRRKEKGTELRKEWDKLRAKEIKAFMDYIEISPEEASLFNTWLEDTTSEPFAKKHFKTMFAKAETEQQQEQTKIAIFTVYHKHLGKKGISFEDYAKSKGFIIQEELGEWLAWEA